jgi:hypothetical protein
MWFDVSLKPQWPIYEGKGSKYNLVFYISPANICEAAFMRNMHAASST